MQMNKRLKLPKLSETVADFDMKRIKFLSLCVCVCAVDKRDESLAQLLFARMFETKVCSKGSFSVIHRMFCPLSVCVKADQMVHN